MPKHAAFLLRAQKYAEKRGLLINWIKAHDTPLHRDDLSLGQEQLDAKRKRWLSFHDQKTAGILGLLPLIKGLPVRLTDSIDRPLKLYKHRRGTIVGWTLHADEASVPAGNQRLLDSTRNAHLHRALPYWRGAVRQAAAPRRLRTIRPHALAYHKLCVCVVVAVLTSVDWTTCLNAYS